MIPSVIQRSSRRGGLGENRLPLMIVGGVGAVVILLCGWVLLTMGNEPTQEPVTMDVPTNL